MESEKILIDSRRPIAGNGDTASSLFLVQNLIRRGYKGVVDILVDEKSERILRSLSKNLPGFAYSIRVFHESELSSEPYSMVIRSGLPSGRVFDLGLNRLGTKDTGVAGKININDSTLFLSLTIYGNTENRASVQPLSLVVSDNKYYLMPATGLGVNRSEDTRLDLDADKNELSFQEGGIFRDPFSLAIRNWSLATTEKFLLKQTTEFNPQLGQLMAKVIEARKTEGVKYSGLWFFNSSRQASGP
ncbi:MAG: hypothetical protein IPM97_00105 [Bdellovibrionaceae bacterium]|nr:hypothetical protein [Pseudobdellovibrionaceae bacterium]